MVAGLVGVHFYREATRPAPVQPPPKKVAEKPAPKLTVPMVSRTLTSGQTVSMDDVALVRLTREQMLEAGITKAFMSKPEQIIGKTVKRELRRGSTFDTRDFYPTGQGPGIAHRLKPGLRAITVAMLPTNALIGFAGAGQSVDVLFHYGHGDASASATEGSRRRRGNQNLPADLRAATSTLIQDAEILAFNKQTNEVAETKNVPMDERVLVTLAVFPREAELLRLATGHGELSMTLRSPRDSESVPTVSPRTLDEIIQVKSDVRQMEIFRGKQVSRLQFDRGTIIKKTITDGGRDNEDYRTSGVEASDTPSQPGDVTQSEDKKNVEARPVVWSGR